MDLVPFSWISCCPTINPCFEPIVYVLCFFIVKQNSQLLDFLLQNPERIQKPNKGFILKQCLMFFISYLNMFKFIEL